MKHHTNIAGEWRVGDRCLIKHPNQIDPIYAELNFIDIDGYILVFGDGMYKRVFLKDEESDIENIDANYRLGGIKHGK